MQVCLHAEKARLSNSNQTALTCRVFDVLLSEPTPEMAVMHAQRVEVQLKRHKEVARLAATPPEEHADKVCRRGLRPLSPLPS